MNTPAYNPERRPIRSREWNFSRRTAGWLARRGVTANRISASGMVCGVLAGLALALTARPGWERWGFLAAAALMQLRLQANMLDGMVALATHTASPVGELYNEVPDRVADTAIFLGAGAAAGSRPMLGALTACVALFVAYVRAEGKVAGAAQQFCGPMAKQQRMATVTVVSLFCGLAPQTWQPRVSVGGHDCGLMAGALGLIIAGGIWTALRRLRRIAWQLRNPAP